MYSASKTMANPMSICSSGGFGMEIPYTSIRGRLPKRNVMTYQPEGTTLRLI